MSFRNGDKSREHRQRKAKLKKRESARKLLSKTEAKAGPTGSPAKKVA